MLIVLKEPSELKSSIDRDRRVSQQLGLTVNGERTSHAD
jgi:hypothetical protein